MVGGRGGGGGIIRTTTPGTHSTCNRATSVKVEGKNFKIRQDVIELKSWLRTPKTGALFKYCIVSPHALCSHFKAHTGCGQTEEATTLSGSGFLSCRIVHLFVWRNLSARSTLRRVQMQAFRQRYGKDLSIVTVPCAARL